jgi:D-beta-D-heptose 7-phosphate kinase/D-beta-D-heptose 1-phosphate adenosyltransferase
VVGHELVESWGGRVELVEFVDGRSTSGIIEKIVERYGTEAEVGE